MTVLKQIPIEQLRVGMFLHQLCGSWINHPFWRTRFLLNDLRDLTKLRESGVAEVVIDVSRGIDTGDRHTAPAPLGGLAEEATEAAEAASAPTATPAPAPGGMAREYVQAAALCRKALLPVSALYKEARLGKAIVADTCIPMVEEIVDSVSRQPNTLISIARLKTVDDYTYMHSIAVSALMVALAKQLGLAPAQVREAGLAGLLLDTGKARMPADLLNKPGRLAERELDVLRTHPKHSHTLLKDGGGASAAVLDAALHHHERIDGTGYPDKLSGDRIGLLSRMAAVCDVYDAVTSRRPYKAAWDPGEAMRHMAQAKGQFDQRIVQSFVKAVGIYPVGSLVRLQSERLAVVLGPGKGTLLTPRVKVFYSVEERHAIEAFEIDLGDERAGDRIAGVESPDAWRFPALDKLWLQT